MSYLKKDYFIRILIDFIKIIGSGLEKLILTNACGGIREDLVPGSIMIIRDHILVALVKGIITQW